MNNNKKNTYNSRDTSVIILKMIANSSPLNDITNLINLVEIHDKWNIRKNWTDFLNQSVRYTRVDLVDYFLQKFPYNPVEKYTALFIATGYHNLDIVNTLMFAGADPTINDGSILPRCSFYGNLPFVKSFLEKHSFSRPQIEKALYHAFLNDRLEIVQYLINEQKQDISLIFTYIDKFNFESDHAVQNWANPLRNIIDLKNKLSDDLNNKDSDNKRLKI